MTNLNKNTHDISDTEYQFPKPVPRLKGRKVLANEDEKSYTDLLNKYALNPSVIYPDNTDSLSYNYLDGLSGRDCFDDKTPAMD
ncbi:MAG: hypothetical protein PV340_03270 [Wolbachia sp.]|nr:hypothetical protein [Wolbachia sp.]MDD9336157.1 hypothetical protein [Wolbachia sp.]